ncbi:putative minor tail protein [Mycobacterium phage PP]|uniref:Putative minor tail protein n=1 Tax=Mycobacterium phage PP TaxID=2077134 RepID=A0A2Z5XVF5_9CAUD|nr:minor tail protein [Mycobacterium phage PP]BBC53833.1 putative minor tail protein [Mycobacterium phage PP]
MTPFNPDDWMDVLALAIMAGFSFAGVVVPVLLNNHRRNAKTLGDIKEQVSNSHETNLRDDIDELAKAVRDGFKETREDISGLRRDLRTEREERIEGDRLRIIRGG